jgi:hypothetical protein
MSIVLLGSTSGSITLAEPAVAGTNTLSLPAVTATLATDVNGTLYPLTSGTAVASTSGTSIDFTSIPSWVKRITVMLNGVSTNGTSAIIIQLGDSGGIEATGYNSTGEFVEDNNAGTAFTTGFALNNVSVAAEIYRGIASICLVGSNAWVYQSTMNNGATAMLLGAGSKTTSATLDRIRITTVNGTDTFDAGTINILYE